MVDNIRSENDQTSQYSIIKMKGNHKIPPLPEELIAFHAYWEKKTQYSSVMWLMVGGRVPLGDTLYTYRQ